LIVAAYHPDDLQQKVASISSAATFETGVELLLDQAGNTRPDLPGHEHFGSRTAFHNRQFAALIRRMTQSATHTRAIPDKTFYGPSN
jgi:hypothetical protein